MSMTFAAENGVRDDSDHARAAARKAKPAPLKPKGAAPGEEKFVVRCHPELRLSACAGAHADRLTGPNAIATRFPRASESVSQLALEMWSGVLA